MIEHDERDDYDDLRYEWPLADAETVLLPAGIMWVLGFVQLLLTQLGMVYMWIVTFENDREDANSSVLCSSLFIWPIMTASAVVMMIGADRFRRFQQYRLVFSATIITLLSLPCFCLAVFQVPLAIWIIVLLVRGDVRGRFEANQKGPA
jgi:hypothetical protein